MSGSSLVICEGNKKLTRRRKQFFLISSTLICWELSNNLIKLKLLTYYCELVLISNFFNKFYNFRELVFYQIFCLSLKCIILECLEPSLKASWVWQRLWQTDNKVYSISCFSFFPVILHFFFMFFSLPCCNKLDFFLCSLCVFFFILSSFCYANIDFLFLKNV